jgi:hypothetical protein
MSDRDTAGISDAQIDAAVEKWGRAENEALERAHGQGILDAVARRSQGSGEDPVLDTLRRAHQAKAEADEQ